MTKLPTWCWRCNYGQNLALANAVYQSVSMAGVHEDWMEQLESRGLLDRELEFLPSTEAMEIRRNNHKGLTSPELAVLLAYTKIVLEDEILASDLPDDPPGGPVDQLFPERDAGALRRSGCERTGCIERSSPRWCSTSS